MATSAIDPILDIYSKDSKFKKIKERRVWEWRDQAVQYDDLTYNIRIVSWNPGNTNRQQMRAEKWMKWASIIILQEFHPELTKTLDENGFAVVRNKGDPSASQGATAIAVKREIMDALIVEDSHIEWYPAYVNKCVLVDPRTSSYWDFVKFHLPIENWQKTEMDESRANNLLFMRYILNNNIPVLARDENAKGMRLVDWLNLKEADKTSWRWTDETNLTSTFVNAWESRFPGWKRKLSAAEFEKIRGDHDEKYNMFCEHVNNPSFNTPGKSKSWKIEWIIATITLKKPLFGSTTLRCGSMHCEAASCSTKTTQMDKLIAIPLARPCDVWGFDLNGACRPQKNNDGVTFRTTASVDVAIEDVLAFKQQESPYPPFPERNSEYQGSHCFGNFDQDVVAMWMPPGSNLLNHKGGDSGFFDLSNKMLGLRETDTDSHRLMFLRLKTKTKGEASAKQKAKSYQRSQEWHRAKRDQPDRDNNIQYSTKTAKVSLNLCKDIEPPTVRECICRFLKNSKRR